MQVIIDEGLVDNSHRLGGVLREALRAIEHPKLRGVRGKGLMNAIIIDDTAGASAMDVCLALRDRGLLAKPTHGNIIRYAFVRICCFVRTCCFVRICCFHPCSYAPRATSRAGLHYTEQHTWRRRDRARAHAG